MSARGNAPAPETVCGRRGQGSSRETSARGIAGVVPVVYTLTHQPKCVLCSGRMALLGALMAFRFDD